MVKRNIPNTAVTMRDISCESFFSKALRGHHDVLLRISNFRYVTCIHFGEPGNGNFVSFSNLPLELKRAYARKNLVATDPIVRMAQTQSAPLFFSEALDRDGIKDIDELIVSSGIDFDGYVVPVRHGLKRGVVCFADNLAGDGAKRLHAVRREILENEAEVFHKQFCDALDLMACDPHQLSSREGEVLAFLSEGKTQAEIADHISLSQKSIELYLRNARKKLDARTTSHAVSIFVRMERNLQ
jgi:DNA-binding CsgD family transcriptional regulator